MERISINELIANPALLTYDNSYGFYDWFCQDKSLEKKALGFIPKLKFLVKEGVLDGDNTYVWFKNNCPMNGSLYDDMRISSLNEDNDFLGGFCPKTGHNSVEKKCSVWLLKGFDFGEKFDEFEFENWRALQNEIKTNPAFKARLTENFKG